MNLANVVKGPVVTEKFERIREEHNGYGFVVDRRANKTEIRQAMEQFFKVNVIEVRTAILRGKKKRVGRSIGRRPNWKRAVVILKEGQSIEFDSE
jgi:large subunit ribosomal protein L23